MKSYQMILVAVCLGLAGCMQSEMPSGENSVWVSFSAADDPGMSMYRNALFSPDWQLQLLNPMEWESALHNQAVGVVMNGEGRVIEAAGFWGGRRSDNVYVAEKAPLLRFSYQDRSETVTMHHADGSPFPADGVYGYRVTRDSETGVSVKVFLGEDGEVIQAGEVAEIRFEPQGEGWYVAGTYNPAGELLSGPESVRERFRFDDNWNTIAMEVVNSEGVPQEIRYGAFTFEMVYDMNGNIIEGKKLDENGAVLNNPAYPGWQIYENSEEGLLVESFVYGPDGEPAEDYTGTHRRQVSYDEYGRMTSMRGYDADDEPVVTAGVLETGIKYDEEFLVKTVTTYGVSGSPVDLSGIAETVIAFDAVGNVVEMTFWDSEGEPARDAVGVHRYLQEYDEYCLLLEKTAWEPDGEPGVSSIGHHTERFQYQDGIRIGSEMLDIDGNPVN